MDVFIIIFGSILLLAGVIGCFIPVIPGPPIAFVALLGLLLHSSVSAHPSTSVLFSYGIAVALITALDFFLPIWGTKKFGGTTAGKRGSTIGLILSFFIPILGPFTILVGPFIGAFVGELVAGQNRTLALNSAIGSFLGFLAGTLIKLAMVGLIIWQFVKLVI